MKKLLSVTFFSAFLTLSRMLAGFAVAKVIAVYTGTLGMATLGQVQNLITILNGIITAPVGNAVVRFTSEHCESGYNACAPWWRAALQWVGLLAGIIIPVGFFSSGYISQWLFNDRDLSWLIKLMVVVLPLSAVATFINSIINGQQKYRRYITLGIISVFISSIVMMVMIIYGGLTGALIAASVQAALIGLIMLIFSLRQPWLKISYWWGTVTLYHRKQIGGYILMAVTSAICMPLALIGVRNELIEHAGWDAAGQWQAVWKISEVYLSVITLGLGTYFLPKLAKLSDYKEIRKEINGTLLVVIPVICLMAIIIYFLRDTAITILYTEKFRPARELFLIQLVGDVIKIASWIYAYPMIARGTAKWFIGSEIFFSTMLVVLSTVFIPFYHASGANLAYLINYCLYFMFMLCFFKKIIAK
ncbi:O-antigen translocase [Cronobacter sp. JZ38]|uniref:O-antigen translocase n=1 Tax=Cronobacter sp. JZ38 TaxID=1906275 RepID=UPI0012A138EF|nr:O-antigen translocase [Cronobacter sp. JZ38]